MSVTALCLVLALSAPQSDVREVASLVKVHSADHIVVKFRNFRDFEDGRWVTRDVTLIGVRAPRKTEPGFKESLAWAKARYKIGDLVSGCYYPFGKEKYLGDIYVKGTSAITNVLEAGMGRFDEARVPASIKCSAGYEVT